MPKVLLAWELGGGLGHLVPLRAIGMELVRRGYDVAIAANNVPLCQQGFAGTSVEVVEAPRLPPSEHRLKFPCTYSDILHDCGYSSPGQLMTAVARWLELFDLIKPNLLLCDHSPTALLASRAHDLATAALGTGFVCPPDISPLPSLHPQITEPHWADEVEQTVLENINSALKAMSVKPIERVSQLFAAANRQYLMTLRELDHYARWRTAETRYWQPVGTLPGVRCAWPVGPGIAPESPRVFVHLRGDAPVIPLLQGLALKRIATVCCAPHMPDSDRNSFAGTSVTVSSSPVDLRQLILTCDATVLNGGHGSVCNFLQAGVPMLLLPLMLEQLVTAHRLFDLGIGLHSPLEDLNSIGTSLQSLLENPHYLESARTLSQQIHVGEEAKALAQLVDNICNEVLD